MIRKTLLLAMFLSSAAWANDKPVYAPAPEWVKPAPPIDMATINDETPIFLVLDQQQRIADGQVWHYMESATRIASPQVLAQAGTIQLPWSPDRGELVVHGASILRGSETIDLLSGGKQLSVIRREQKLEQMQLDGMLTATMPVEGLRVGDVLRLRFSMTRKDPTLGGEVQSSVPLFGEPMRVQFGRARMIWPEKAKVNWKAYAGYAKPQVSNIGGYREVSFDLPIGKQVEVPKDAPARYQPIPVVDVTSYPDWSAVARTMALLYATKGLIAAQSPLAKEVAAIAAASNDPRVRTAGALQVVQDKVRYLFNGMAQGNYVPQTPAETWSVRYGDCKAKSLLLLAMLHELGIEAEAVLVHSSLGDMLPDRLPMPGAFDHVIVRATIAGESLWLDGTSSGDRLADLGNVPGFRHVLPLRIAGAELVELPIRPSMRADADAEIDLDQRAGIHLPAPFTARLTLRGQLVQMLRAASAAVGKDEIDQMVGGAIGEYVANGSYSLRKLSFDDAAGTAVLTAAGVAYPVWTRESDRFKLTLDNAVQNIAFDPDRSRSVWRDIPVATGAPGHVRVRTSHRLPAGGTGFAFEGDEKLPAQLAGRVLSRSASLTADKVMLDDRRIVTGAEVAPADIGAARQQLAQAKARLLRAVAPAGHPQRWEEVTAARKNGGLQKILAIYGQRIAAEPDESEGYIHRAWFLERVFDYPGAIKDLDKAIALEPSVDSHLRRSALLSAVGQIDEAIADANAARELDPGSSEAISTAINLLSEQGKRSQALDMVEEQIASAGKDKPGYLAMKADLLAEDGRAEEGVAVLDAAITAHPGNPILLNSRCWLKGTYQVALDTALRDCTRAIELSDDPAAPLDSRAMVYFRMARHDEALSDLDAALDAQPDMPAALYLRGVVRKAAGRAGGDEDLAGARLMSPRIDAEYGKWGIKP